MTGEISLPNVGFKITFTSPDETICSLYQKHFRTDSHIAIKNVSAVELKGFDCLVVPMNSGFGLKCSAGLTSNLLGYE